MAAKFPSPGEVFEEAYRIEAILGSGGFARVYRAVEEDLNRPVALKILRPPVNSAQSDTDRDSYLETLTERFQREAMLLSKLRSNYTVNLHKYGKTEDGLLYMALEYIDGLSLAEIMRAGKPLEPSRVAKIIKQVLASLQEAHSLGMLHRDLKPANIMVFEHLGEKDQVKLLDFGIAKLVTESQPGMKADLTSDGTLIGTPRYMAPEQIQGSDIGPPADIYALGLVAYELLTGERAIKGDSSIQIIGKQLAPQSFELPESPNIPPMLRDVVNSMMAKEIPQRYQSADAVIEALEDEGLLAVELGDIEIEEVQPEDLDLQTVEDVPLFDEEPFKTAGLGDEDTGQFEEEDELAVAQKNAPVGLIVLGVVALLVVVGGIAIFTGQDEPTDEQSKTDPLVEKTKAKDDEDSLEKLDEQKSATVRITARLDGKDVEGATVLVNGVEKGVTPLILEAPEVENSQLVARYKPIDAEKPLEEVQEVTNPRDVLFEFDDVVGELIKPENPKPEKAEPSTKPDPPRDKPKPHKPRKPRKPRDTHTKRPDPKPKPKPDNPYFVPE